MARAQDQQIAAMADVLRAARRHIKSERAKTARSLCLFSNKGRPRPSTLSADDYRLWLAPLDRLLTKIDRVLL